jgi:hypothetical protein
MISRHFQFILLGILLAGFVLACGQEDPTFRPDGGGTAAKGKIFVSSTVPGARISLDGRDTGFETPDTVKQVDPGTHILGVRLGGFFPPEEQSVEVEADSVELVHFDLVQLPQVGRVWVTAPFPAAILIDGAPTGLACPDTVDGVEPGARLVTLVLPGFRSDPGEQSVTVVAGETVDADFALLVDKLVVCEDFSNYDCGPCPAADAALQEAMDNVGRAHVISVNPHVSFPGAGDPMFQFNRDANNARTFFNEVGQAPTITVDGIRATELSVGALQARIESALAVRAPLAIGVEGHLTSTTYEVTADIWAVDAGIPSDLLLFVFVVERDVYLETPGTNGQREYTNVLRELFPVPPMNSTGGEALGTLAPGTHRHYDYVFDLPSGVDPSELGAVAFAQRSPRGQHTIVQTGVSFAIP